MQIEEIKTNIASIHENQSILENDLSMQKISKELNIQWEHIKINNWVDNFAEEKVSGKINWFCRPPINLAE